MAGDGEEPKPNKSAVVKDGHLAVSEFLGEHQGPSSPFGDITLPLPNDQIDYVHPGAEEHAAH